MGTAGYMAPEQVRGQAVDARTDLFAFGAVLYEMLTGQRAFKRDTAAETMTAILKEDPPELTASRADLSPALERIVRHCLEKNPAERFQTARDVAFALEAFSGSATSGTARCRADPSASTMTWRRRYCQPARCVVIGAASRCGRPGRPSNERRVTVVARPSRPRPFSAKRLATRGSCRTPNDCLCRSCRKDGSANLYVLRADAVEPQRIAARARCFRSVQDRRVGCHDLNAARAAAGGTLLHSGAHELGGAPRTVLEQVRRCRLGTRRFTCGYSRSRRKVPSRVPIGTTLYETTSALGGSGTSNGGIRVSPDGSRVAFFEQVSQGDERCSMRVVDRSAHVTTLTREFLWSDGLAWTPDGQRWFSRPRAGTSSEFQLHVRYGDSRITGAHPASECRGLDLRDLGTTGRCWRRGWRSARAWWRCCRERWRARMSWLDQSAAPILSWDGAWLLFTDFGAVDLVVRSQCSGEPTALLPSDWVKASRWACHRTPSGPSRWYPEPSYLASCSMPPGRVTDRAAEGPDRTGHDRRLVS